MSLDLLKIFNSEVTIYYCVDRFSYSSAVAKKIKKSERYLVQQSDLVFASTQYLAADLLPYRSDVHTLYFGVNTENFEKVRDHQLPIPEDIHQMKHPIIGYAWGVHKWIDFGLIKHIAQAHPEYSIVFVGPIQTDISILSGQKNVYFLNQKDYADLPLYIKEFDVGIIPYILSDYTHVGRPTKLNEYLIMGKPVVSTEMPEVVLFSKQCSNITFIGRNNEEFTGCIENVLQQANSVAVQRRIAIAEENAWENKIEEMCSLITEKIEKKREEEELRWRDVFVEFFRSAKKRLVLLCTAALILYFAVFYSPFIFWAAEPLKI